jgi:hypothetical protein
MRVCSICHQNECEDGTYCSSCEAAVTKLGALMQSMGVTAEEAEKAIRAMYKKEEVDE